MLEKVLVNSHGLITCLKRGIYCLWARRLPSTTQKKGTEPWGPSPLHIFVLRARHLLTARFKTHLPLSPYQQTIKLKTNPRREARTSALTGKERSQEGAVSRHLPSKHAGAVPGLSRRGGHGAGAGTKGRALPAGKPGCGEGGGSGQLYPAAPRICPTPGSSRCANPAGLAPSYPSSSPPPASGSTWSPAPWRAQPRQHQPPRVTATALPRTRSQPPLKLPSRQRRCGPPPTRPDSSRRPWPCPSRCRSAPRCCWPAGRAGRCRYGRTAVGRDRP